ncbi:MAG: (2Fe-2S)-binding protein [Acidobacteria bacterium]|nr:(2Fe-2S)-binding protein [Acidobacteriota bacterium]
MVSYLRLHFTVNGTPQALRIPANTLLLDLLRDRIGLKGAKVGCSRGVCGACTVLVDGQPVAGCSTFAFQAQGAMVETIEGLARDGALHPVQQAFIDHAALQCGYCTAGMILLAKALLAHDPDPDRATIVEWLSSNVCRCTGYQLIVEAVEDAARRMRQAAQDDPGAEA